MSSAVTTDYDAILIISFGGPEQPEDVIPFLENVLRGRNVPHERLLEVAEHYYQFGGKSPINQQVRDLMAALRSELDRRKITLPMYWGNRNWHPLLADTLRQMSDDGRQRAIGLVLSAYSSYSSCRQYLEDIAAARETLGGNVPTVEKIRVFYNHPEFIAACTERVQTALERLRGEQSKNESRTGATAGLPSSASAASTNVNRPQIVYTAHSIPSSMSAGCDYVQQLTETCRLVSEQLGIGEEDWRLVYQSRSGRPTDPWLEPDICDHLATLKEQGIEQVVIMPIGFLSDHLEVLYDLDVEARTVCDELGITMVRAATVGTHPRFVGMLGELIAERLDESLARRAVGQFASHHDTCPADCCPAPQRPPRPAAH